MKSRLIKFACHNCGTKLAVPPEMAGVTDQCPKCGTTITAPQESAVELPKRKTRFAPVPKAQPDAPALPGWSASELADALRPPAPLPTYTPAPAEPPPVPQHSLQPDPPAIPEPEPVFMPKRKPRSEGSVAVAPPPPPPPAARSDHPILGSILDSPNISRGGAAKPAAYQPGLSITAPPLPPPSQLEVPPAPAPPLAVEPDVPEAVSEAPAVPPLPPPLVETPALTDVSAEAPTQQLPTQETAEPQAEAPETMAHPEEASPVSEQQHQEESTATEPRSSPTALVPESLPDARAAEEAAMLGMGEMLAGQVAQDPASPPDARDHRPLLHVPFLPVAESPHKERRQLRRKMYIVGVVLFFILDAALAVWFFTRGPVAEQGAENTTAPTKEPSTASEKPPMSGVPNIGAPSDFASKESGTESPAPPKPTTPPMAIPLPGHASANVPTATPIPSNEVAVAQPKPVDPAPAPPPAPVVPPAPTAAVAPTPENPPAKSSTPDPATAQAPPTGSSQPMAAASPPGPTPAPVSAPPPVPPSPASDPTVAPGNNPPAGGGTAPTIAAIMGPQPTPPTTITEADPPAWLKRVVPTFPAIDGTPLLPAAGSQPVAAPPPLPPAPGSAQTTPGTTDPAAPPAPGTEASPASSSSTLWVGKAPAEAQSALTTLRNFLAAPTWQERAAFVQKPELVKPAMEKHAAKYGDGPIVPATIKFVDRHPGKDGGPPYSMFEIDGGTLKHEVLVLIEQPAQGLPLIDWASFVEFKDDLLLKFLETKGEPNQTFRVLLSRKHYFAKDVPDLTSKDSFQVQQPNDRFDGHVFLPKSTALSKKLATQLGWNQNMPVIVELAWRTNGKLHWVEIVSIVNYGWRG